MESEDVVCAMSLRGWNEGGHSVTCQLRLIHVPSTIVPTIPDGRPAKYVSLEAREDARRVRNRLHVRKYRGRKVTLLDAMAKL